MTPSVAAADDTKLSDATEYAPVLLKTAPTSSDCLVYSALLTYLRTYGLGGVLSVDCWTANESGACRVNTSWGAIRIGLYVRHVSRWLRRFPLSQIHFVHGEQLVRDPAAQIRLVERFLGLRPVVDESHFQLDPVKGFPCIVRRSSGEVRQPHCLGKTKGRTHPKIADQVLRRLREFFRPFNQQFYQAVGFDFGWS